MAQAKQWKLDIFIDEHDRATRAEARLHNPDQARLVGVGMARCNPDDLPVPEIGDELAVARALADLSHQLLNASAQDIEATTQEPVHLTG